MSVSPLLDQTFPITVTLLKATDLNLFSLGQWALALQPHHTAFPAIHQKQLQK
jgi:hypothetical protein